MDNFGYNVRSLLFIDGNPPIAGVEDEKFIKRNIEVVDFFNCFTDWLSIISSFSLAHLLAINTIEIFCLDSKVRLD